jgi:hypothetical protein
MAWEGYWSRYGKYNDFNVYGLFGRDRPSNSDVALIMGASLNCI